MQDGKHEKGEVRSAPQGKKLTMGQKQYLKM